MPCWISYQINNEIFSDLSILERAAEELGMSISRVGNNTIAFNNAKNRITGVFENDVWKVSGEKNAISSLKDEYISAKIQKEAHRRRFSTKKTKINNEITIELTRS